MAQVKKLIEVALPLEKINAEAAREKSIRHGHPSTLHLWWARRPLAAARAVIWASLVDDPSSHPEEFPTEEAQAAERERLFRILEQLVVWENSNNEQVLAAAKAEIMKSTNGNPPELLDPFAGGGAIPLEAQRLGLKAHAHDLNPVAVMINKAMIEIPPRFAGMPPVNPEARAKFGADTKWKGAAGLAEDVRYYGEWMKQEAFKKIGYLYPKVQVPLEQGGGEATVIDYIWARTVKCPNPACGCEIPLIKSFYISQRKNKEVWLKPTINSKKITLEIKHGNRNVPEGTVDQKIQGAKCLCCNSHVDFEYLRNCASKGEMGLRLIAVALDINKQKTYISGDDIPDTIYNICPPAMHPSIELPNKALGFRIQQYGMKDYSDLFTPRQLNMLTCFSDLVKDVKQKIQDDMCLVETTDLLPSEYSIAIITYLAFVVDRMANYGSSLCLWDSRGGTVVQTFGRQALSFIWNFAEPNPFSNTNVAGEWTNTVEVVARALSGLPYNSIIQGSANQHNAMEKISIKNLMISTDPPYYDNIGYADLSNFFYLWMRNSLHDYYQPLFNTIQVPKNEELIANPFRFETKEEAKRFFEKGMQEAFSTFHGYAIDDIPVTVYYAFKQSETEKDETSSTGWETMLSAIINSGFSITGTWPMATENPGGLRVNNRNALSSSIILVCRKRPIDSSSTTRRNFIAELKRELRPALQKLQASSIAPVDLAQSAIGPGMGVFSKYKQVLDADGKPMSVRAALQIINQELDVYFNEQDGVLDADSRFCVELYTQFAFNELKYGDADTLARAKNTSVEKIAAAGAISAKKGTVRLLERDEMPGDVKATDTFIWRLTQQLTHAMEKGGIEAVAALTAGMMGGNAEAAKDLAYRLFTIADRKKWNAEAYAYNNLVSAWPDIQSRAAEVRRATPKQESLF